MNYKPEHNLKKKALRYMPLKCHMPNLITFFIMLTYLLQLDSIKKTKSKSKFKACWSMMTFAKRVLYCYARPE